MTEPLFSNWKIFPLKSPIGNLIANGSVDFGGIVNLHFTIIRGPKGVFASLPSHKGTKVDPETGKIPYYPEVSIISKEHYEELQNGVKKELAKALGAGSNKSGNGVKPKTSEPGEEDQTYSDTYLF